MSEVHTSAVMFDCQRCGFRYPAERGWCSNCGAVGVREVHTSRVMSTHDLWVQMTSEAAERGLTLSEYFDSLVTPDSIREVLDALAERERKESNVSSTSSELHTSRITTTTRRPR